MRSPNSVKMSIDGVGDDGTDPGTGGGISSSGVVTAFAPSFQRCFIVCCAIFLCMYVLIILATLTEAKHCFRLLPISLCEAHHMVLEASDRAPLAMVRSPNSLSSAIAAHSNGNETREESATRRCACKCNCTCNDGTTAALEVSPANTSDFTGNSAASFDSSSIATNAHSSAVITAISHRPAGNAATSTSTPSTPSTPSPKPPLLSPIPVSYEPKSCASCTNANARNHSLPHLLHVVVSQYDESVAWLTDAVPDSSWPFTFSYTIINEAHVKSARGQIARADLTGPGWFTDPIGSRCNEAGKYLHFIVQEYPHFAQMHVSQRNPSVLLFLHGHAEAYHRIRPKLINMSWPFPLHLQVERFKQNGLQYLSVADRSVYMYTRKGGFQFNRLDELWPSLYGDEADLGKQSPQHEIGRYCCAEFLVTLERILARPLTFWQRLEQFCQTADMIPQEGGRVLEDTWHMLFGQPRESPRYDQCDVIRCE